MAYDIERIANYHCKCGENPLWLDSAGLFFWEDIPTCRVFQYDPATGQHQVIHEGDQNVGGFTFQEDGKLLLFRERDIARLDDEGKATPIIDFEDEGVPRFNDVMAGPDGRVLAGTMGKDQRGGLYLVDHDGTITNLWRGTNCSNGMAFTEDLATLYWTDSTAKVIYACDYDRATGKPSNRRTLVEVPQGEGTPDGMTLDTDGRLISTRFGGAGVFVYSPQGKLIEKIPMPVEKITSCILGGPALHDLYITTAGGDPDKPDGEAGSLYRIQNFAQGRPEFRSKLRV